MADSLTDGIARIVSAALQGQASNVSDDDLRLINRLTAGNKEATLAVSGLVAGLVANEILKHLPDGLGPKFPGQDGPEPITPTHPGNPSHPQPITPTHPGNPSHPQPINPDGSLPIDILDGLGRPWAQQAVNFVILDEFLVPAELETINDFAMENQGRFEASLVVSPGDTAGTVDFRSRRSRVITELGNLGEMFGERVRRVLPHVGQQLGIEARDAQVIDVQMTASNDGEFFVAHVDDGETFKSRAISYVYFFHKEPAAFTGGELRLFDSKSMDEATQRPTRFTTIEPAQNQIVFFPSAILHEVTPVSVPSRDFSDSRFTVNGWVNI